MRNKSNYSKLIKGHFVDTPNILNIREILSMQIGTLSQLLLTTLGSIYWNAYWQEYNDLENELNDLLTKFK